MPNKGDVVTAYYPVQYPFTLDLNWDPRDESQPSGTLQRLVNYIPKGQILVSRSGITVVTHTPDTSWGVPEDPKDPE